MGEQTQRDPALLVTQKGSALGGGQVEDRDTSRPDECENLVSRRSAVIG
jgi:hypothetical protein